MYNIVSVKGFNWKNEMKAYMPPYAHNNGADTADIPRDAPEEHINSDNDVSVVIFGGLEEKTRRLFKSDPDTHHLMNSGFVADEDGWIGPD
jgi:hypothetical protein